MGQAGFIIFRKCLLFEINNIANVIQAVDESSIKVSMNLFVYNLESAILLNK